MRLAIDHVTNRQLDTTIAVQSASPHGTDVCYVGLHSLCLFLSSASHVSVFPLIQDGLYTYLDTPDNKVLVVDFNKESFWERGDLYVYPPSCHFSLNAQTK